MNEKAFSITKVPRFHGPHRLDKQGIYIRELAPKTPGLECLCSEANCDTWAKWCLDILPARNKAALTTANTGGNLVPREVIGDLIKLARHTSVALKYCPTYPFTKGSEVTVPKELTLPEVNWYDENEQISETDPTFGQGHASETTTPVKKCGGLSKMSNEFLNDSKYDIVSKISEMIIHMIGLEIDKQVFTGTGSPVSGLISAAGYSTILTGAFSTITPANITESIAKISEGNYPNLRFVVGRTQGHLLHSSSTQQLNPVYDPIDKVNRLYGFPLEVSEGISSEDGSGKAFGFLANLKSFTLVYHQEMRIFLDSFSRFAYDETILRLMQKWGFAMTEASSFCKILTAE